jgi:hypothetical protein
VAWFPWDGEAHLAQAGNETQQAFTGEDHDQRFHERYAEPRIHDKRKMQDGIASRIDEEQKRNVRTSLSKLQHA